MTYFVFLSVTAHRQGISFPISGQRVTRLVRLVNMWITLAITVHRLSNRGALVLKILAFERLHPLRPSLQPAHGPVVAMRRRRGRCHDIGAMDEQLGDELELVVANGLCQDRLDLVVCHVGAEDGEDVVLQLRAVEARHALCHVVAH